MNRNTHKNTIVAGFALWILSLIMSGIFQEKINPQIKKKEVISLLGTLLNETFPEKVKEKKFSPQENNSKEERGVYDVLKVVDGDTIVIDYNGIDEKVRILGINSPESVDPRRPVQCFGLEASHYAKNLLENEQVRIVFDSTEPQRDKYQRLLAYVYRVSDNLFFNDEMVRAGYAYEYTYRGFYDMQSVLQKSEEIAKSQSLGLWSPDTCNGRDKKYPPKVKKSKN